jgi:peptidoglycan/LPS O-acetylase OafA/YrhL
MFKNTQTLAQLLQRDSNNLDLLRLVAACAVIYGHAFSLLPNSGAYDLVFKLTGFYAADLAVKTFFFLSGLLITNSLLVGQSVTRYGITRVARIWPGLVLVVLCTTLVIGPLVTTLSLQDYFGHIATYRHLVYIAAFKGWGAGGLGANALPGVFETNPYPGAVNAPLWTLMVEAFVYIFIAACWVLGLLSRRAAPWLFAAIVMDSLLPKTMLFHWLPTNSHDFSIMPFCFALGGIMAVFKDRIQMDWRLPLAIFALAALMRGSALDQHLAYAGIFLFLVLVFSTATAIRLRPKHDISYGVYLWGWPLQQSVAHWFPTLGTSAYQLICVTLAVCMAWFSWILVEQRSMLLGRRLCEKWG